MSSENTTQKQRKMGYIECDTCDSLLLLEAGFEVETKVCERCGEDVVSREEFFNVPIEILSK